MDSTWGLTRASVFSCVTWEQCSLPAEAIARTKRIKCAPFPAVTVEGHSMVPRCPWGTNGQDSGPPRSPASVCGPANPGDLVSCLSAPPGSPADTPPYSTSRPLPHARPGGCHLPQMTATPTNWPLSSSYPQFPHGSPHSQDDAYKGTCHPVTQLFDSPPGLLRA